MGVWGAETPRIKRKYGGREAPEIRRRVWGQQHPQEDKKFKVTSQIAATILGYDKILAGISKIEAKTRANKRRQGCTKRTKQIHTTKARRPPNGWCGIWGGEAVLTVRSGL